MAMVPQSCPLPVLITRPHAQALRFAAQLTAEYGDTVAPVIAPLLAPVFLRPELPDAGFGAIVLSSETGARAAAALRDDGAILPDLALCVGDQTAQVARDLGFVAQSAAGDVQDLLALVRQHAGQGPFLHLHGRDTTGDLVADIRAAGLVAQAAVVYAQQQCPLNDAALSLLATNARICVPVFSPRSAGQLCDALVGKPIAAQLVVVAISVAAAWAIPAEIAENPIIAARPDGPSMVAAIGAARFKP